MRIKCLLFLCLLLPACASVHSVDRPASYFPDVSETSNDGLLDGAVLQEDDEKISKLLNHKLRLPDQNRIAILKLSSDNYWQFYSDDFTQVNEAMVESLIMKLRSSERVYDASFLPAMLLSEKRNVPIIREAAARFQADLLLAYRSNCQSYQKYKIINPNETKSYCSVESVLLDVRSGVIVKSSVSTESFLAVKSDSDTNFRETIKKAELEAIAKALGNAADEIVRFLATVPVISTN